MRTPARALTKQQLPLQRRQPRRLFGQHRRQHRPDAEPPGVIALQHHFGDAAFDHRDPDPAVGDVLRGDHRPAQVKTRRAIKLADRGRDRAEVGQRYLLAEIGLVGIPQRLARDRRGAGDGHGAQFKLRPGIAGAGGWLGEMRHPHPGPRRLRLPGLERVETFFGLPRVEARLARRLGHRRANRRQQHQWAQDRARKGTLMPPGGRRPSYSYAVQRGTWRICQPHDFS